MEVTQAKTESLIPYALNAREHGQQQVDRIANSIAQFGFNQPIVVDEQSVVLVGHGRLEAAKKLGLTEVPVVRKTELTESQKKAYRILDNKLQNDSTWNFESLEVELEALAEDDFDLSSWGLDELRELFEEEEEAAEDDFTPTAERETIIKLGDLIELGEHRLICADSTKAEELERLLAEEKVDLLLTDPPYNLAQETDLLAKTAAHSKAYPNLEVAGWDENFNPEDFLKSAFPLLKKDAWMAVFTSHFLFGQIATLLKEATGWTSFYAWCKPNPMPSLMKKNFTSAVELCVLAKQGSPVFNYPEGCHALNFMVQTRKRYDGHPTAKTVEVISELMTRMSARGAVVLDCFLGSGTTLITAEQLGRRCFGVEISPSYCQLIVERYESHCRKSGKSFTCKVNGEDVSDFVCKMKESDSI